MNNRYAIPLAVAVAMVFGVWIGTKMTTGSSSAESRGWEKIDEILRYVEADYVDTVSRKSLEDEVIAYLLQRLDPHSRYIGQDRLQALNEPLDGGFEGIGVQFNLRNDTVYIINTIANGPAERAGAKAGDRIVMVEEDTIAGRGISTAEVMSLLKGETGSEVKISVQRKGSQSFIDLNITRGDIALESIEAVFPVDSSTLYVRIVRFAKTTVDEFEEKVISQTDKGYENIILDLRGNGGGYLGASIAIADEFLESGKLITYTQGKSRPRQDYFATRDGEFENTGLVILMDGYSASASEVLAGAMQDHKRGLIIGERSYGKGLVQEQNEWPDGSATRLTVARYYTPDGRSIQRPYEMMDEENPHDFLNSDLDSNHQGGIIPDMKVGSDTSAVSWLYAEVMHRGLLAEFTFKYRDQRLDEFKSLSEDDFISNLSIDSLKASLRQFLVENKVQINEREWNKSSTHMTIRAKALIGRTLYSEATYFRINSQIDPYVKKALFSFRNRAS